MNITRIKALAVMALVALASVAAPKSSILTLRETIDDNDIVFPYSFETNTQELMENWYLQNYAVMDKDVESKNPGMVSDAEFIKRLKAIPSGIELPYNLVVRKYIQRYVERSRTLVEEMLGMSLYYFPIFEQALEKESVPLELRYIPIIESAMNPNAVSPVGAAGLWQFMLGTARGEGLEVNSLVDMRRDPYASSEAAARYFKKLYGIYGDWSLAIAAYNCGPGNVNKALQRAGQGKDGSKPDFWAIYNYLPRETRGYVPAFIAATYVMNYYKEHNISPSLAKKPLVTDTVHISHRINFNQISKVLNMPIAELRILNPQYRADVIPGTKTHPYSLALPSQQIYSFILAEDSIENYRKDLYAQRETAEPGGPSTNNSVAKLRASSGGYHKVQRGETLKSIAKDYGMDVDDLMALNGLTRSRVSRGQVLKVPTEDGSIESEPLTDDNDGMTSVTDDSDYSYVPPKEDTLTQTAVTVHPPVEPVQASQQTQGQSPDDYYAQQIKEDNRRAEAAKKKAEADRRAEEKKAADRRAAEERRAAQKKAEADRRAAEEKKAAERKAAERKAADRKAAEKKRDDNDRDVADVHTVKAGESLRSIADDYGLTLTEIKKANPGVDNSLVKGQKIKIPAKGSKSASSRKSRDRDDDRATSRSKSRNRDRDNDDRASRRSRTHTVERGESLEKIARHNGITVDELKRANDLKGDMVKAGQELKIPKKSSRSSKSKKRK